MRATTMGRLACAAVVAAGTIASANDGTNLVTNPSFEDPAASGGLPLGWGGINVGSSGYVDITDPDGFVRTGNKSVKIEPGGPAAAFQGITTNIFRPDGSDLFDPDYEYLGGDVTVSGWYLVPSGQTLANDTAIGIKLEFRREPPNFSIYTSAEFNITQMSTDGEWVKFEATFTDAQMEAVGDFPPYATSVSVLIQRFWGGGDAPTGTIYWDDMCLVQGETGCNRADLAQPFGVLNFADVQSFLGAFGSGLPAADLAAPAGVFNFADVQTFLGLFGAGC